VDRLRVANGFNGYLAFAYDAAGNRIGPYIYDHRKWLESMGLIRFRGQVDYAA
jgi:hypothetical protein